MLKPDRLFSDGMVLQQGQVVPVWGLADPGAPVAVTMQGQTAHATADAQGRWQALCGPFAASFDEEMTITAPGQQCTLRDVQVGEVWLAGGQSNMEFHMRYDADFPQEKETCQNSALRFFDYPEVSYPGQIEEADYGKHYAFWRQATPESLERFSAVGYYFRQRNCNSGTRCRSASSVATGAAHRPPPGCPPLPSARAAGRLARRIRRRHQGTGP